VSSAIRKEPSRKYVRREASAIKVKYRVVGQEVEGAFQRARDISGGGIRFPVSKRLAQGAKLELGLKLPQETRTIHAQAEVVWSGRIHGRRSYEVGCRFTQIDPLDRGKIIHYIHEALKHCKPR
jgi:c-di-GMP-binding flagellar brake protein YcgR